MSKLVMVLGLLAFGSLYGQINTVEATLDFRTISYIKNEGQWKENIRYQSPLGTGTVFLENNAFTYVQTDPKDVDHAHKHAGDADHDHEDIIHAHAWRTTFLGANPSPEILESNERTEYYNYFIGNDRSKWASRVPLFDIVQYQSLYDGIDMKVYGSNGHFKYDFIVAPGSSTAQIKMSYKGADQLLIRDGDLIVGTSVGEIIEQKPYAYQQINGVETPVVCEYQLNGQEVSFVFPEGYNEAFPLVIDPTLIGATLSGSAVTNFGHSATYDNDENIYTGARNFGAGYPATTGAYQLTFGGGGTDIAVSKLNPDGSALIYATYLGGGGDDLVHSMVVSETDELYVLGTTQSVDYPTTGGAFDATGPTGGVEWDIVVTHLNIDGTDAIGSTYVGTDGSDGQNGLTSNYADEFRGEIIVDLDGNCYIASCTSSDDFPVTAGAYQETYGGGVQDAVIFSMPPDLGSMNFSTYLGNTMGEGAFSLRLDAAGDLYVCGTAQNDFMAMTGYQDAYQGGSLDGYVIHLIDDGTAIDASSYWGTTARDAAFFLDVGPDGNVFLYGQSDGGTSEVTAGVYSNAGSQQFICKLSPDLNDLEFATVVGAGGNDFVPIAFMVDACGYIYFSGHGDLGNITGVPLTGDALYTTGGMYLGVLQPEAVDMEFSTLYSGNHVDGGTSRFDPANGTVYQAVCSCEPFTTTAGSYSDTPGGFCDMAVFKIDFGISHVNANANANPAASGCVPFTVDFENTGVGVSYLWDFGDGSATSTEFEPSHTYTSAGVYTVELIAYDPDGCLTSDTAYLEIIVNDAVTPIGSFDYDVDCATGEVSITYTGDAGAPVVFNMGDGTTYDDYEFTHAYSGTGTFTITLTTGDGVCAPPHVISEDILLGEPAVEIIFNPPTCFGFSDGSITVDVLSPTGAEVITITDVDGALLNLGGSNAANSLSSGWYYYSVDLGDGCSMMDSVELIDPPAINAQLNLTNPLCHGDATGIAVVDTVYFSQGAYDDIVYIWEPDPMVISGVGADSLWGLGAGTYTLTLNDANGCSQVFDFEITEPPILEFSEIGMNPAYCRLYSYQKGNGQVFAAAIGGTPDYTYQWENLGTGETSTNTTWGGLNPGDYQMTATDQNGCILTQIVVVDSLNPIAEFDVIIDQEQTDCDAVVPVQITFVNQSNYFANPLNPLADTNFWFNPDWDNVDWTLSNDLNQQFSYTYAQSGTYQVCLTTQNKNGCADTTCKELLICDDIEFLPVNIFSPDGDGINDEFTFIYKSKAIVEFNCIIVNRWGRTITEFNDINATWDGTDKGGKDVPDGVYFYIYTGTGQTGDTIEGQGTVQIVRGI